MQNCTWQEERAVGHHLGQFSLYFVVGEKAVKVHDDVRLTTHMVGCKMMNPEGWRGP